MTHTHKPTQITAIEYTQAMQDTFIALGKNPKQNPIDVTIEGIPTAKLTFNWHTQKLHLQQRDGEKEISVGDYICRLDDSEKPIHFRLTKKKLEKYYTITQ